MNHWHTCSCRGPNYFEVDIDVGSSKSAASVVGLVQGALKGLVIDMAITMEGHSKVVLFAAAFMTKTLLSGFAVCTTPCSVYYCPVGNGWHHSHPFERLHPGRIYYLCGLSLFALLVCAALSSLALFVCAL